MEPATATITVLMTDLVGSTELLRHGADAFDEIRRVHLDTLREALNEHHGDEVKSTGDGIMATFTSATHAAAAATAIQQTVDRLRRRDPRSPAVRVGIAAGEATSEDGDWYGPPVIEAARLCAEADGGQILATATLPLLVGSRGGHVFRPLGERHLKGFDEPTPIVEQTWEQADDPQQLPLPPAAELAATGLFVGREDELEALSQMWKAAVSDQRRAVLLAGEPGVGKTRLVGELAVTAGTEGATVLWGRCDEEASVAYQPFVEALRHWARHRPSADFEPDPTGELARLVPELGEAPADGETTPSVGDDPEGERLRLFDAVSDLLVGLASRRPVLLVLDDVQWAARPTLLLLRHLVRDPRPTALMIAATYRDTDLDRTHPLAGVLADLRREPIVERRSIAGLGASGVAAYLDAAAGEHLGEEASALAAAIHRETEGNPFFVGEVLRHLVETGALARAGDGGWTMTATIDEIGIPEGVREVVGHRLSRLSAASNRALAVAAVLGREFDLRTLQAVPDAGDPELLLDAVEEAVRVHLVDETGPPGQFAFSHALVRQTLLAELSAARRARIHRWVGEALAERPDVPPALVAHHLGAGITDDCADLAVRWATAAMEDCRVRLAPEETIATGERALAALEVLDRPRAALRAELLVPLSAAIQSTGDINEAKGLADEAIAAARSAGDPVLLGRAVANRVSWGQAGVPDAPAGALLAEALDGLGERDPVLRAALLSVQALYRGINQNLGAAAVPDAAAAVELLRDAGEPELLLNALFVLGTVLQGTADLDPQRAVLEEIRRVEAASTERVRRLNAFSRNRLGVVVAMRCGDRPAVEAAIAEAFADVASRSGAGRLPRALASMWRAMTHLADGRFEEAEAETAPLLEMATHDINFQNSWAALTFRIALERGRAGDFVPLIRDAAAQTPDLIALRTVLARALVATGELEEARSVFRSLAGDGFAAVPRDTLLTAALGDLTDTCLLLGTDEVAPASDLYRLLLPYAGQLQVTAWGVNCLGAVDRYLGMLELLQGHYGAADTHFASALALEESIGATALTSRTRLWWARLLARRDAPGDAKRSADLAAEAEHAARSVGQTDVADAAAALRS